MSETKMTRKEMKIESNERIISSAIECFGRRGYTNASFIDIAKGAGVTSGLLTQRYGTKENLFLSAYLKVLDGAFRDAKIDYTPRECLYMIIEDIEAMRAENGAVFEFINMLHSSSDYPSEILRNHQNELKETNSYRILSDAQKRKMLPEGNLDVLLASFGAMVFNSVNICHRYNLERKNPDQYLKWIGFSDRISEKNDRWFKILEKAIENTFEVLVYIDVDRNYGEMIKRADMYFDNEKSMDLRGDTLKSIERDVLEEDIEYVKSQMDFDTLPDRIRGRKSLSFKYRRKGGNIMVHSFIPLWSDEEGKVKEFFAGIYELREEKNER